MHTRQYQQQAQEGWYYTATYPQPRYKRLLQTPGLKVPHHHTQRWTNDTSPRVADARVKGTNAQVSRVPICFHEKSSSKPEHLRILNHSATPYPGVEKQKENLERRFIPAEYNRTQRTMEEQSQKREREKERREESSLQPCTLNQTKPTNPHPKTSQSS